MPLNPPQKTTGSARPSAQKTDDVNAQISSKLHQLYETVREEEIPDRFLDLLEKLDEAEKASGRETSK
ncbi:NepR family anti-sigma factor [Nisaea nitritireducens]|uniref:NepR family anti-sigma factor n=1 Tax=Nisaea nitritireducens TaxID=568392 RepID=UPI001866FC47|nr:NepR family anti-sigma factor [Nisaea nitritireducens]